MRVVGWLQAQPFVRARPHRHHGLLHGRSGQLPRRVRRCPTSITAAAPFYGGGIPIERTDGLRAPVLAFFGDQDAFIPIDQVHKLKKRGAAPRQDGRGRRLSRGAARLLLQRARLVPTRRRQGRLDAAHAVLRAASEGLSVRILLVGQAAFAEKVLDGLAAAGDTIAAVVCPPDAGPKPDPVKVAAAGPEHPGAPVSQPEGGRRAARVRGRARRPRRPGLRHADRSRAAAPSAHPHGHLLPSVAPAALPRRQRHQLAAHPRRDPDRGHRLLAGRGRRHRPDPAAARRAGRTRRHRRIALLPDAVPARRADDARRGRHGPRRDGAARAAGRGAGDLRSAAAATRTPSSTGRVRRRRCTT